MPTPATDETLLLILKALVPILDQNLIPGEDHHDTSLLEIHVRLDTIDSRLTEIFDKLEEIRVFHERYITERRLPRTSAASILMSELYGNEDLDDDSEQAIYGKDFIIDPTDPAIPSILGGNFATDEFGDTIFPVESDVPIKTWEEYLATIEDESYHP